LSEPPSDDLLRDPFAELPSIDVCGIEEIHAEFERLVHDDGTVRFRRVVAEIHGAKAQSADLQAGAAELDVLYGWRAAFMFGFFRR
jgi:hypothetical protein